MMSHQLSRALQKTRRTCPDLLVQFTPPGSVRLVHVVPHTRGEIRYVRISLGHSKLILVQVYIDLADYREGAILGDIDSIFASQLIICIPIVFAGLNSFLDS